MAAVRYPEGVSHGFLVLRTQDGKPIADGDSTQVARGDRVTDRMRFRFKDGSIYEESTVFSQHGTFKLLSDHVLEKGPIFKRPMETAIDGTSGQVTVRYTDDGKEKVLTERLELPPDVANGILFTLLKNVQRSTPRTTVSYVAATPKPRLVNLWDHSTRPETILDRQLQSQSHSLHRESENRRHSRVDRVLTDFRDALNRVRTAAWAAQQYVIRKETEQDSGSVLSLLVGERIRVTYQLCQVISDDLKRTDVEFQAGSLVQLYEATKALTLNGFINKRGWCFIQPRRGGNVAILRFTTIADQFDGCATNC
jgi:hypothetical protein